MKSVTLSWTNPTTNVDGTPLTQANIAGYQVDIDNSTVTALPGMTFGTSFDISTLAEVQALPPGPHTITLAVLNTDGEVSDEATPVTFLRATKPNPPSNLAIS